MIKALQTGCDALLMPLKWLLSGFYKHHIVVIQRDDILISAASFHKAFTHVSTQLFY